MNLEYVEGLCSKLNCLGSFQTLRLDDPFWLNILGNLNLIQTYRLHPDKNATKKIYSSSWALTIDAET